MIVWRGLPTVRAEFERYDDRVQRAVQREVLSASLNIQTDAKRRVPVDTGRLRNSISTQRDPDGMSARIGTNVEYAPYVEFGTRRQSAKPYLVPAAESERPKFFQRLRRAIAEAAR